MSPVRYELGFYIPEDGVPRSDRRENLKSYIVSAVYNSLRQLVSMVTRTCFMNNYKFHYKNSLLYVQRGSNCRLSHFICNYQNSFPPKWMT
jgi:hypothetical protein